MENKKIEELIEKYKNEIKNVSKKYFLVDGSEDDLFQEGLIGFVQGVKNYDWTRGDEDSETFKKFVFMCEKRQLLDAVKKSNSKKNGPLNTYISFTNDSDQEMTEYIDVKEENSLNPEEIIMDKLDREEKQNILNFSLSEFEREVLNLYLDGEKQSEIAIRLNKPVKSIDNTLQRIKTKLRNN